MTNPKYTEGAKPCPNNSGVLCWRMDCSKCGWNPEVAFERKEKIALTRQMPMEEE